MSEQNESSGGVSRCLAVVQKGLRTAADCVELLNALTADLTHGCLTPEVGNAISDAVGKLLKGLRNDDDYADLTSRLRALLDVSKSA